MFPPVFRSWLKGPTVAVFGWLCVLPLAAQSATTIQKVVVLPDRNQVELEISASRPVDPQVQVVHDPTRLVIDFANAVPGSALRNVPVNRGEVKGVRVGLFAKDPPVTRVVLDLTSMEQYQIFPSGNHVIVKLGEMVKPAASPSPLPPSATNVPPVPPPPKPRMTVEYRDGKLTISSDRATLAEILGEVQHQTGAQIIIPPEAGSGYVFAHMGPGPIQQVLARLLNGSSFNFVMVGSETNPGQLQSLVLTPRVGGPPSMPANVPPSQPSVDNAAPEQGMDLSERPANPDDMMQQPDVPPIPEDSPEISTTPEGTPSEGAPPMEGSPAPPDMAPRRHRGGEVPADANPPQ